MTFRGHPGGFYPVIWKVTAQTLILSHLKNEQEDKCPRSWYYRTGAVDVARRAGLGLAPLQEEPAASATCCAHCTGLRCLVGLSVAGPRRTCIAYIQTHTLMQLQVCARVFISRSICVQHCPHPRLLFSADAMPGVMDAWLPSSHIVVTSSL